MMIKVKPAPATSDATDVVADSILTARAQQDATRVEWQPCLTDSYSRWRRAAEARVASLAKPPGSLGTLEAWYVTLCAVQETLEPSAGPACAIVFVGDHGLAKQDIGLWEYSLNFSLSEYPQAATQTMFRALAGGVSCAAVLARSVGASLVVVDVGIDGDVSNAQAANGVEVIHAKVARGTAAFPSPAMTSHVHYTCADDLGDHSHSHHEHTCDGHGPCLDAALLVGRDRVAAAAASGARTVCIGEVGVGNDAAAACLLALLTGSTAKTCCGCSVGFRIDAVQTIIDAVRAGSGMCPGIEWPGGLARESLRCVGGLEMAAMVGAYVVAPAYGIVCVVDGFVSGVAALCAARLNPVCRANMVFATSLCPPLAEALGARTFLDANLSHGEGCAAVLALPLLRAAAALPGAATLEEAMAL